MIPDAQLAQTLTAARATFVSRKQGIEWWKLGNGDWLAIRRAGNGMADVRKVAASACNCG